MQSGVRHVPVLHLKFGENRGDVAYDSSPKGNDGDIEGATWVKGFLGPALDFDGGDDYVNIADADSLDITDAITIEARIKQDTIKTYNMILTKGKTYRLWISFSTLRPQIYVDGAWRNFQASTSLVPYIGTWTHIAITYDSETHVMIAYLNGVSDGSYTLPAGLSTYLISTDNKKLTINILGTDGFDGIIDEVRVYDRALTAREILELYYGME